MYKAVEGIKATLSFQKNRLPFQLINLCYVNAKNSAIKIPSLGGYRISGNGVHMYKCVGDLLC